MGLMELDKHHIPPYRGVYGPYIPSIFAFNLSAKYKQIWAVLNHSNPHKNAYTLYYKGNSSRKRFFHKKEQQQTEKSVVKNRLIRRFGGINATNSPLNEDL